MESLMSDTAGFQKILEMSKLEEEARIKKQKTISANESRLLDQGIRQSKTFKEADVDIDQKELDMMQQVMEMSKKESENKNIV